jgi:hypothetical protein
MTGRPLVSTFVVGTSLMFLGVQGAQVADPLIEAPRAVETPEQQQLVLNDE